MPDGFSGISAQFDSGPLPNCAAIPARKTGAVWRDAVWQWLLYFMINTRGNEAQSPQNQEAISPFNF